MLGEYNFTMAGLRNAEQHGITPAEVWQVLTGSRRLVWVVGESSRVVIGATEQGRFLVVLVQEDPNDEDDSWDIVAARDLPEEHVQAYRRLIEGGRP